jgi:beta-lactam-binding protein with PASTA domain
MIGSFGLWSSSKGMKVVSNLVGMTRSVAASTIASDGFVLGTETPFNSSNPSDLSLNNTIRSQNPAAGVLFTYELPINLVYTSFSFVPFSVFGFSPFSVFAFR